MAASPSFESIVIGQIPPDGWYTLGVDTRFPHLLPTSDLVGLAIDIELDWQTSSRLVPVFRDIDIDMATPAVDENLQINLERWKIFGNIYDLMEKNFMDELVSDGATVTLDYDSALDCAYRLQHQNIGRLSDFISPSRQAELSRLVNTVCGLYAFEEELHFSALKQ